MSPDQRTVEILTDPRLNEAQKRQELRVLNQKLRVAMGSECPECASHDIEDNGARRSDERVYLCKACTHQWEATSV